MRCSRLRCWPARGELLIAERLLIVAESSAGGAADRRRAPRPTSWSGWSTRTSHPKTVLRPMRRLIQREVGFLLAQSVLRGEAKAVTAPC